MTSEAYTQLGRTALGSGRGRGRGTAEAWASVVLNLRRSSPTSRLQTRARGSLRLRLRPLLARLGRTFVYNYTIKFLFL